MSTPQIVNREDWLAAREQLLTREKEHTHLADELALARRQLPWLAVDTSYTLQTADGPRTLAQLFDGRSQLVVYHFMFGPDYDHGCPVCSSIADSFNGVLEQLKARDTTMICASQAPVDKLEAEKERLGWKFTWASSYESDFNSDFEHSLSREQTNAWVPGAPPIVAQNAADCGTDPAGYMTQRPGLSVFALHDGQVYLTYASTARGLEVVMTYYGILDRTPLGRNEGEPAYPTWMRRHDEFAAA
ncbi:MAG TPA: DUF899 domain-containing protein [Solirubrobacteraceae bacterium]|nr:DUF899 domain-containing protein [Solirubrobacteraceae bacterium]